MSVSPQAAEMLQQYTEKAQALNQSSNAAAAAIRTKYRRQMEPLLAERQAILNAVPNFWSTVLSSANTPLAPLLNGTIDPKILRAVTEFKVETAEKNGALVRRVSITLRANMFAEQGVIFREVDSSMHTVAVAPIAWKPNTEKARTDSLFAFFEQDVLRGVEFITEALEAFDIIFQNPFLATVAD